MCIYNFYGYYWCEICQMITYHKNGICTVCYPHQSYPQQFNYECPDCKGKFNYPYQKSDETTDYQIINVCPFCGKKMKGLN